MNLGVEGNILLVELRELKDDATRFGENLETILKFMLVTDMYERNILQNGMEKLHKKKTQREIKENEFSVSQRIIIWS